MTPTKLTYYLAWVLVAGLVGYAIWSYWKMHRGSLDDLSAEEIKRRVEMS